MQRIKCGVALILMGMVLGLFPFFNVCAYSNPVITITDIASGSIDEKNITSTLNNINNNLVTEKFFDSNFLNCSYASSSKTMTIEIDKSSYSTLRQEDKQLVMEIVLNGIQNSDIRAVNRTKLEKFGISLGEPEQEPVIAVSEPKILNAQEAIIEAKKSPKNEQNALPLNNTIAGEPEHAVIRPSYLELNPIVGGTWTVDAEKIKEIQIVKGDKNVLIDTLKALEIFTEGNKVIENPKKKYENDPIYILIEKCKKKEAQINISVNAALPGKSIYNLIKDEYDEADLGTFFDILIDNLDTQIIKDSIKKALVEAYSKE